MYNADQTEQFSIQPFGSSYTGGVHVAVGDVTGDSVPDLVAVTNGGTRAQARIIDGVTGSVLPNELFPRGKYSGQVSVAVGDVTGDGIDDIAIGTDQGGSRVRVYRGGDFVNLADFHSGNATNFKGHTQVALADMTGDGQADLAVSGLYTTGTRVWGYRGDSLELGAKPENTFQKFTLGGGYINGLFLALGDVDGDRVADLIIGTGAAVKPKVSVFSGQMLLASRSCTKIASFTPEGSSSKQGVQVAVRDVNGDGQLDILTSSGELVSAFQGGSVSSVSTFTVTASPALPPLVFSFDPNPVGKHSVWVG